MMKVVLIVALALVVAHVHAGIVSQLRVKEYKRVMDQKYGEGSDGSAGFDIAFYSQTIDHFNAQDKRRYNQRYFMNDAFWDKENGPVFLLIEGEGQANETWVLRGHMVEMAKQFHALCIALEHRFYGVSIPTVDLTTPNLAYLSSHQALADVVEFVGWAKTNDKFKMTAKNEWYAFGGSYPGMLAGWARLRYPHLFAGAIASSAPVRAEFNFEGYNDVVAASLANPLIGGSDKCAATIADVFAKIDKMLADPLQRPDLLKAFNGCGTTSLTTQKDQITFSESTMGFFQGLVQYNGKYPDTVRTVCDAFLKSTDTFALLAKYTVDGSTPTKEGCIDYSWDYMMQDLKHTVTDNPAQNGRQWTYQTCTEFGFYQTCDATSKCLFSKGISIDYSVWICDELFGVDSAWNQEKITYSNNYYGSITPEGSRVVWVNGEIDPWHYLSVMKARKGQPVVYIPSGSHCSNMYAAKPTDMNDVLDARVQIKNYIASWIANEDEEGDTTNCHWVGILCGIGGALLVWTVLMCYVLRRFPDHDCTCENCSSLCQHFCLSCGCIKEKPVAQQPLLATSA